MYKFKIVFFSEDTKQAKGILLLAESYHVNGTHSVDTQSRQQMIYDGKEYIIDCRAIRKPIEQGKEYICYGSWIDTKRNGVLTLHLTSIFDSPPGEMKNGHTHSSVNRRKFEKPIQISEAEKTEEIRNHFQ